MTCDCPTTGGALPEGAIESPYDTDTDPEPEEPCPPGYRPHAVQGLCVPIPTGLSAAETADAQRAEAALLVGGKKWEDSPGIVTGNSCPEGFYYDAGACHPINGNGNGNGIAWSPGTILAGAFALFLLFGRK